MKRRDIGTMLLAGGILSACGLFGDDPPPPPPAPPPSPVKALPTVVSLTFRASENVNPDRYGLPKPVWVTIYRLKAGETFNLADYQGLPSAIDRDLVAADRIFVRPGGTEVYQRKFEDEARFFGLAADYYNIGRVEWRALHEVARDRTTLMNVVLDDQGITLVKPGL